MTDLTFGIAAEATLKGVSSTSIETMCNAFGHSTASALGITRSSYRTAKEATLKIRFLELAAQTIDAGVIRVTGMLAS